LGVLNLKGLYRIFLDLQKMSLVCRECGTPHTRCPLWSMGHVFGIITSQPLSSPPYSPSGDAKSSSLGLIHGNLHHYPATTHKRHAYTINVIIGIISLNNEYITFVQNVRGNGWNNQERTIPRHCISRN